MLFDGCVYDRVFRAGSCYANRGFVPALHVDSSKMWKARLIITGLPGLWRVAAREMASEGGSGVKRSVWGRIGLSVRILAGLGRLVINPFGVSRREWEGRVVGVCEGGCPVYDSRLKRCGPYDGAAAKGLGCGCFVPFLAMVKRPYRRRKGCWARQMELTREDGTGMGWE